MDDERDGGETPPDRPLDDRGKVVDAVAEVVVAGADVDAVGLPDEGVRHGAGV